jgi:hypothetical protein
MMNELLPSQEGFHFVRTQDFGSDGDGCDESSLREPDEEEIVKSSLLL